MELSDKAIKNSYTVTVYGKGLIEAVFHRELPSSADIVRRTQLMDENIRTALDGSPAEFINILTNITALNKIRLTPKAINIYLKLIKEPKINKVAVVGNSSSAKMTINFIFFGSPKVKYFSDRVNAEKWLMR